jgi:lysophospholipase L1-like esterase
MGDSYTAGNGARTPDGDRSYYGPAKCMRSHDTWGEQYADYLTAQGYAVTLLNRACSAATSENMLNHRYLKRTDSLVYPEVEPTEAPLPDTFYTDWAAARPECTPVPGSEEYILTGVTRAQSPAGGQSVTVTCEHWLRPQVDALNPDVDLVLFTVGGNDAKFPDIMRQCLVMSSVPGCQQAINAGEDYGRNQFQDDLTEVFNEIHTRTDGNAKVVYLGYPRLEMSEDLIITSLVDGKIGHLPVAAELDRLLDEGATAQRAAVDAANATYGPGFVTFLDGIKDIFRGHEADARPAVANPNRWIAEAFETTVKDEWYHFRPEGHRAIAEYVSSFRAFGAGGGIPARDVALVSDGAPGVLEAFVSAADTELDGAYVSVVEQRLAGDGVGLERRVVASGLDLPDFKAWVSQGASSDAQWHNAADVVLSARWNATQQVLFVGDASVGVGATHTLWSGAEFGGHSPATTAVVDTGASTLALPGDYVWAPGNTADAVRAATSRLGSAPHAWAGGPYSLSPAGEVVLDAAGSFAPTSLHFEWDLDHDGIFETPAAGPQLRLAAGELVPGWVAVRVTSAGGAQSVAMTYVGTGALPVIDVSGACTGEVGSTSSQGAAVGGALGSPGRGGGEACQPLAAEAPWTDYPGVPGAVSQPAASQQAEHNALLLLIADPQLFTEERTQRSVALASRRGLAGTRASSPSRLRPRQLVARERAVEALLRTDATVLI